MSDLPAPEDGDLDHDAEADHDPVPLTPQEMADVDQGDPPAGDD